MMDFQQLVEILTRGTFLIGTGFYLWTVGYNKRTR